MAHRKKRGYGRQTIAFLVIVSGVLALMAACGPPPPVYIPDEYRAPQERHDTGQPQAAGSQGGISPQGPVVEHPHGFTKQDIAPSSEPPAARVVEPEKVSAPPPPQHTASVELVDRAKVSLAKGKPDAAISALERAIHADVNNGEAFLVLARAWKQKGARHKALEFAKKAEVLSEDQPARLKETLLLESELYGELGDKTRAGECRRKASGLK